MNYYLFCLQLSNSAQPIKPAHTPKKHEANHFLPCSSCDLTALACRKNMRIQISWHNFKSSSVSSSQLLTIWLLDLRGICQCQSQNIAKLQQNLCSRSARRSSFKTPIEIMAIVFSTHLFKECPIISGATPSRGIIEEGAPLFDYTVISSPKKLPNYVSFFIVYREKDKFLCTLLVLPALADDQKQWNRQIQLLLTKLQPCARGKVIYMGFCTVVWLTLLFLSLKPGRISLHPSTECVISKEQRARMGKYMNVYRPIYAVS